ncbi:MAG: SUMF1/EgtB/PvdO family nonheme iron enzyme [Candidatus Contendobacter sp.]|nr:SUMF1/EgtB/PvdO family nonheme iron enzyme [Candidatus Contendobacter sp.]
MHHDEPAPALTGAGAEGQSTPAPDATGFFELETELAVLEGGCETLAAGMVIGPVERRFRLLSELGGRGYIWLARVVTSAPKANEGPPEEFRAIKIFLLPTAGAREASRDDRTLRADLIGLRSYLTRVKARVELALKLDHPHIARAYGWWHGADGWPFVEMEYVDHQRGRSLTQLLGEQGRNGFPFETVLEWLRPVAAALDDGRRECRLAHQHLDADTVFVTQEGMVKLLGFGLATEPREPRSVLFSAGTFAVAADRPVESVAVETTFRRDVFALALLVYQLLTGRSAYEGQSEQPNMVPRPGGLTDETWRVLRRGLAYPSELCPTDAGKFLSDLEVAQRPAMVNGYRRASGWKRWGLAAAGLSLAVVLGYALVGGHRGVSDSDRPAAGDVTPTTTAQDVGLNISARDAERESDRRAFESARRLDTLSAYRLYLQHCPRCGYEKEAQSAIARLETQEKISQIKVSFDESARALEREGRSDQGDAALSRLEALAALAPDDPLIAAGRRRLALGWAALAQASLNRGDLAHARNWLKKAESAQPKQLELARLSQALEQAETEVRARQLDAEAFAVARRANSRRAYWTYLERCAPGCGHRAEAEAALARLAPVHPVRRDRLSDGSQGPEMVTVPAGGFLMGSPLHEKGRYNDEAPHPTRIEKSFAIGKYEVMFYEYDRFAAATGRVLPNDQGWGRGRRPVVNVTWHDAVAYADWLSKQTGARYRLPTEAEWEYAARAGSAASRYWGDDPDQGCAYANAADLDGKQVFVGWAVMKCRDGQVYTAPVGSYHDNDFGLHDVLGNVLEWTCSLYHKENPAPIQRCEETAGDRQFVVRGGSWNDEPRNVRLADRHRSQPDFQDYFLGFRLVRELP